MSYFVLWRRMKVNGHMGRMELFELSSEVDLSNELSLVQLSCQLSLSLSLSLSKAWEGRKQRRRKEDPWNALLLCMPTLFSSSSSPLTKFVVVFFLPGFVVVVRIQRRRRQRRRQRLKSASTNGKRLFKAFEISRRRRQKGFRIAAPFI